jgi:hypothetical protein
MSVNKFGKNRSVDIRYLNVPYKYLTSIDGQHEAPKLDKKMTLAEYRQMRKELAESWADLGEKMPSDEEVRADYKALSKQAHKKGEEGLDAYLILQKRKPIEVMKNKDKTLCIVDFFGKKKALVGWRNNEKCSISMPKICPIVYKKGKGFILYKGKEILFTDSSGWVF